MIVEITTNANKIQNPSFLWKHLSDTFSFVLTPVDFVDFERGHKSCCARDSTNSDSCSFHSTRMQLGRNSLYKTCRAVWKFEAGCLLLVPPSFVLHIHKTDNCRWTWNLRRSPIHRFAWHLRCQDMHNCCSANSESHELTATRRWEGCLTTGRRSSWWYDDCLITQAYFTGIAAVFNAKRVAWRPIVFSARGLITCLSRPMIALTPSRFANHLVGLYSLLQRGLIEISENWSHTAHAKTFEFDFDSPDRKGTAIQRLPPN